MASWQNLLAKPTNLSESSIEAWFAHIADQVLIGCSLIVGGGVYRFAEVEFYYFTPEHHDPFTHRDSIQLQCGCWYFHRRV